MLWPLPDGGVENGELVHEALRRKLREETGLTVGDPVRTAFLVHVDSPSHPSAWAAAFEVDIRHGRGARRPLVSSGPGRTTTRTTDVNPH
ncbi:NUDIX domain-containing protein [Streptomyces albidoflavus]